MDGARGTAIVEANKIHLTVHICKACKHCIYIFVLMYYKSSTYLSF